MAPKKKRLLIGFGVVYALVVLGVLVHAFLETDGRAREYEWTPQLVGTVLAEKVTLRGLDTLTATEAAALTDAGVDRVELADGRRVAPADAAGKRLGELVLPVGTEVTEALWEHVLQPESALLAEGAEIRVRGEGNIIGFSLTMVLTVLNFLGLLCILYVLVWDPVLSMLDERSETIRSNLDGARAKNTEADELKAEYEKRLAGAKKEREELVAAGQRDGQREREAIVEKAQGEAEKIVAGAREEIEAEVEKARKALRAEIGGLSATIASEILRREMTPEDHEALVQDFLNKVDESGAA